MELQWIGVAFLFGFLARRLGQPPLVGYLAAGLALELIGFRMGTTLQDLTDIGIQLLLFTIGLKLDIGTVRRREVWVTTVVHMVATTTALAGGAWLLGWAGVPLFDQLGVRGALLVGFALSFSSTVFAVKLLEERDDITAIYGRVAIGVLVVQDLVAVVFLVASEAKVPSIWALGLLLLIPVRPLLHRFLVWCGHGELLILGGFALALVGVNLFEWVHLKGDLGALVFGVLAAGHLKSNELARSLHSFKDIFLVGFFLSVGLTGVPTLGAVAIALGLLLLAPIKAALFFLLFTRFDLRARTGLFGAAALANYSEFGLIVGALAVNKSWLDSEWLVAVALALAFTFIAGAPINQRAYQLYHAHRSWFVRFESPQRIPEEQPVNAHDARALVFGMGRVGTSSYDVMKERYGDAVVGFDIDARRIDAHREAGRRVLLASATDEDVWDRLELNRDNLEIVVLAMSSHLENQAAIGLIRDAHCKALIAATARFPDEVDALIDAGADISVHVMAEAGIGLARDALDAHDALEEAAG